MELVFVRLTLSEGRHDWIRIDHISEVITQRSTAVPFEECGSLVVLTTRREVSVRESTAQVLQGITDALKKYHGIFGDDAS